MRFKLNAEVDGEIGLWLSHVAEIHNLSISEVAGRIITAVMKAFEQQRAKEKEQDEDE